MDAEVEGRMVRPHKHEPVRIMIRQGLKQHGVDDAEDGGVGPDAQREGEHGDGGETGARRKPRIAYLTSCLISVHILVL